MAEKIRVTLSLDEYSYNLITNIAEDLGKTKSAVVIELFNLMGPALSHISACKRFVDQGLKNTGEGAFRAFLEGMQKDFEESLEEAEEAFFTPSGEEVKAAEHMQDAASDPLPVRSN